MSVVSINSMLERFILLGHVDKMLCEYFWNPLRAARFIIIRRTRFHCNTPSLCVTFILYIRADEHVKVLVLKPNTTAKAARPKQRGRPPAAPAESAADWGPPGWTKTMNLRTIDARETCLLWAQRMHKMVCRPRK